MGCFLSEPPLPLEISPLYPLPGPTNKVTTTKYTLLSFFPMALIQQFKRLANIYFLVTAIIQSIPVISPLPWYSAVLPLLLVLVVSMAREGTEEYYKYKCDKESNCAEYNVWSKETQTWRAMKSQDLRLGMVIRLKDNEMAPADLLLLQTERPQGILYLQTSSLDGQKALKTKNALKQTQLLQINQLQDMTVTVNPPEASLYKFQAIISWGSKQKYASIRNFVYRNSRPKNSLSMLGLVIYVGKYTKIMMNCGESESKMSWVEKRVNVLMVFIFLIQCFLILTVAGLRTYWVLNYTNMVIDFHLEPVSVEVLLAFSNYFILLNTMIPISLIVSIELVKSIQGYFITEDRLMMALAGDGTIKSAKAFRCSLNEELGMVEYIFTDKTGTLTRNEMVMKNLVIGTQLYQSQQAKTFKSFRIDKDAKSTTPLQIPIQVSASIRINTQMELIQMFLFVVSVCHECVLSINSTPENPVYEGSSPDEIALVSTAMELGWRYEGTHLQNIQLRIPTGYKLTPLQQLEIFEFDSDRKRMSVLVRCHYGIILCSKGADNVIRNLLRLNQQTLEAVNTYVEEFSVRGLRTLLVACRHISEEQYSNFKSKTQGLMDKDKEKKQQHVAELEKDLVLLGATGVEDRLQDKVPETIKDLLQANIKVCMLTGDKLQTAENIAKSCNLISTSTKVATIREKKAIADLALAYRRTGRWKSDGKKVSVIVQGAALVEIINHEMFFTLLEVADSMVCCRVTPKDKASVVKLAKEKLNKIVLSIGDGANDVEMINEAHIGIGLYGNEGMNAVQASDYALPEFKGLWRLLFIHGRWNYLRISGLIKYFFFKNMVFTFPQFIYSFYVGFSGTSIYNGVYLTLFNTVFTALPLVIRALFEQDINYLELVNEGSMEESDDQQTKGELEEDLIPGSKINKNIRELIPSLYIIGQSNLLFRIKEFFFINLEAVACASLVFFLGSSSDASTPFTEYSITIYTAVLFLVTFKLCADIKHWTWLLILTILFTSLVPYLAFVYISSLFTVFAVQGNFEEVFTSLNFYLVVGITSFVSILLTTLIDIIKVKFWPSVLDNARLKLKEKDKQVTEHFVSSSKGDIEMTSSTPSKLSRMDS